VQSANSEYLPVVKDDEEGSRHIMRSSVQKFIEKQNALIDELDKNLKERTKVVDEDVTLFIAALSKEHLEPFFDFVRKYHAGEADAAHTQQKIHKLLNQGPVTRNDLIEKLLKTEFEQERTAEISRLRQELEQLRSGSTDANALHKCEEEKVKLNQTISALSQQVVAQKNDLEKVRGEKNAFEEQNVKLRQEIAAQLEREAAAIMSTNQQVSRLQEQKEKSDAEISALKKQLTEAALPTLPRAGGGEPGHTSPPDNAKMLQVADTLWTEVYHFAALVPMDKNWKADKLGAFLWILLRFLKAHGCAEVDRKEFCLQDLFEKPLQLADHDHFFCGSCIRSYGAGLRKPRFTPVVQEYINDIIIPQRMGYPEFS